MSNATRFGTGDEKSNGVNPNNFGQSVESKAQMEDAEKLATGTDEGELLNVYKLVPIAPPHDALWDNVPWMGEVRVAARTAGDARIVAAGRELDFTEVDALPAEDVTTRNASAFRSEKLYSVIEVERGRSGLKRGVLDNGMRTDTIKPVQE